jgi:hypothetical protein
MFAGDVDGPQLRSPTRHPQHRNATGVALQTRLILRYSGEFMRFNDL